MAGLSCPAVRLNEEKRVIPVDVQADLDANPLAVHHRILAGAYLRGDLSEEAFRGTIARTWARAGGALVPRNADLTLWAIEKAGFVTDDAQGWAALPDPLTIYRGGVNPGASWTTNIDVAKYFLDLARHAGELQQLMSDRGIDIGYERHLGKPILYEHVVTKEKVIAYITGRDEYEIILSRFVWADMERDDFA